MTSRRQTVLDAAVRVLGREGPRGLTHRATDREAGLPAGSTANLFGRRAQLLAGIVERMLELDRELWERSWAGGEPADVQALAGTLARFVRAAVEPWTAEVVRARYHLQLVVPDTTLAGHRLLTAELRERMAAVGADPGNAEMILSALDGLLLRAVTYGGDLLPAEDRIAAWLASSMRPVSRPRRRSPPTPRTPGSPTPVP
ncbi:TetR/AcrR family transcriptional regulator [Georgenia alba]|uniref:TetR/AcrR family transcriptional regulator n=1 Tax=Georgenia alba TaxID=2233858 RepID=A0ABW2Q2S6_9MICO